MSFLGSDKESENDIDQLSIRNTERNDGGFEEKEEDSHRQPVN
jgi:hypothetical protein